MKYVIFDLDNCLADDSARLPKIDWKQLVPDARYAEYHRDVSNDPVGNYDVFQRATLHATPVFLTARPITVGRSNVRQQTVRWIQDHLGVENPLLLMRNVGDNRPSVDLKRTQLNTLGDCGVNLSDVVGAYDDRPDIVAMYREHGIPAEVLCIHDQCAYTPPQSAARRAPQFLEAGAATFRQRNAVYGDTYLDFGQMCSAIFPDGLHVAPRDVQGFNRLGVFVQVLSKVARYAANINDGGHQDSAHDLMVYAAMLQEVTK